MIAVDQNEPTLMIVKLGGSFNYNVWPYLCDHDLICTTLANGGSNEGTLAATILSDIR